MAKIKLPNVLNKDEKNLLRFKLSMQADPEREN